MDGWPTHPSQEGAYKMNESEIQNLVNKLENKGFTEYAVTSINSRIEQVRFSQNSIDLTNLWDEANFHVFVAIGKKIASTVLKDVAEMDITIDKLWKSANSSPENRSFAGINPEKQKYPYNVNHRAVQHDLHEFSQAAIQSALDNGAERVAGTAYNIFEKVRTSTKYNKCEYTTGGIELNIRSFRDGFSGQEGIHWGLQSNVSKSDFERMGSESAETARVTGRKESIEPGKYTVIMSPYVIGNIISSCAESLSYYSVETGMSSFGDQIGRKVAGDGVNLVDDPLDSTGDGFRACDDEATATKKNRIITDGQLNTFFHSYSTAARSGSRTTGNAGIISPMPWQLKILPGRTKLSDMISGMKNGLLIENCWYTRFQDYRNGIFSTVPRDGVFLVQNGAIKGDLSGIRISDSFRNILSNIEEISSETKNAKWWQEVSSTNMPYVKVKNVNISRAF
jgi:PmbA protein